MEIKSISPELQSYLRSGFTIVSPSQTVLELVFNALDAEAKSVAIRAELRSSFTLQVIDDGHGLTREQLDLLGQRYMTSKCHSLTDLSSNLKYYGYRGECLASLREACDEVIIMSRAKGNKKTYTKILKPGDCPPCEEASLKRNCHGVTVIVKNLMCTFPVRQKNIKHHLELEQMKKQILDVCVMHPQVSFTIRDDITKNVILQIKKRHTTREQILFLVANTIKFESSLIHVTLKYKDFDIDGYISREPISQPQYQNIYVNKRLVVNTIIHETVNKLLVKSFYLNITKESNKLKTDGKAKYSVYFINISCPYRHYEMASQPGKENRTFIEFTNWKRVFKVLEMFVEEFLKTEDFVNRTDDNAELNVCGEQTLRKENIEFVEKDGTVVKKAKYTNGGTQQIQEGTKEEESLDHVNDYSLKMVEHFPEHTRKVVKRDNIRDVKSGENSILNQRDEQTDVHMAEMEPLDKEKETSINEVTKSGRDEISNNLEHRSHCVKNQSTERQVTSLRTKIKILKEEIRKSKEKKKMTTSFHSKRNLSSCSKEKMDEYKKHRDGLNTKQQKNITDGRNENNVEIVKQKQVKYGRPLVREEAASIFSKETEKAWNSSTERNQKMRNLTSNENILTQVVFPEPTKKVKNSERRSHDPKGKDITTNENILTGVNTYDLEKHFKNDQETECNYNVFANVTSDDCDFGKLYEVCNLNLFQRFESNDCLLIDHTPHNMNKVEVTPIKVKRKNMRREAKSREKNVQRKDCANQNEMGQEALNDKRETAREDISHNKIVSRSDVIPTNSVPIMNVETTKVSDKKRHSSGPTKNVSRKSSKVDVLQELLQKKVFNRDTESPRSAHENGSRQLAVRPKVREYIDTFHYNPTVVNGHFLEHIRTNTRNTPSSFDIRRRKTNSSRKYPSEEQAKTNSPKADQRKSKILSKDGGHMEQNYPCKSCCKEKRRPENTFNVDDEKLVPYDDSPNYYEMSEEHKETSVDLDQYVNHVLSRSYRLGLHMDSQDTHQQEEDDGFHQNRISFGPYSSNVNHSLEMDSIQSIPLVSSNSRTHLFESPGPDFQRVNQAETRIHNDCCKVIESPDDFSRNRLNVLEDIWEDDTILEHNNDPSVAQSAKLFSICQSSEAHIHPSRRSYEAGDNILERRDLHSNSNVPFSPYFKRSHSKENCKSKYNSVSRTSYGKQSTDETSINNLEGDVRLVIPKWNDKKLILDSSFFRKKFSLTPVLQSSNSNDKHCDEPQINDERSLHGDHYHRNGSHEQVMGNELYSAMKKVRKRIKENFSKYPKRERQERPYQPLSYHCYQNQSADYFERGANVVFDEGVEESSKNDIDYNQPQRKEEAIQSLDLTKNKPYSNAKKTQLSKQRRRSLKEAERNPKKDVRKDDTQIAADNDGPHSNEMQPIAQRNYYQTYFEIGMEEYLNYEVHDHNVVDDQPIDKTNSHQREDEELYNVYKNNIEKWFVPLEETQRYEHFVDKTKDSTEKVTVNDETDVNNREISFQFHPNIPNEDFDDTERIFEEYRVRLLNRGSRDVDEMDEIELDNHMGESDGELIIDEDNGNAMHGVDAGIEDNAVSEIEKSVVLESAGRKTNSRERTQPQSNLPTNNSLELAETEIIENNEDLLENENNHTHPDPKTATNNTLAETEIIETLKTHPDTELVFSSIANVQIIENTKTLVETVQQDDVLSVKPAGNQIKYSVTEILGEELVFNRLGLVAEDSNKVPPPETGFRLQDRYGFMHKGLSPLVLPQAAPDLGRLETSELQHLEEILPSPVMNSLGDNVIDKVVNEEEILLKTNVKSSNLNTMCHVTKDLLNVTFKVIAQVDQKYIIILLDKTLLVAFLNPYAPLLPLLLTRS